MATAETALSPAGVDLPLATALPTQNVTYGANSVVVGTAGTYQIDYLVDGAVDVTGDVTIQVEQNGSALPSTVRTSTWTATEQNSVVGTTLATLSDGDVLTLSASSTSATSLTPSTGTNTYLVVKKVSV